MPQNNPVARRNLTILFLAQVLSYVNAPILVLVLPLLGKELAFSDKLATLPYALLVIGSAMMISPANMLMRRRGRRLGYHCGAFFWIGSGLLGFLAAVAQSFVLICVASLVAGMATSFVHSYRFAATDNAAAGETGKAIGFILLGGVLGGATGAPLASLFHASIPAAPFAGSLLLLSVTGVLIFFIFWFYQNTPDKSAPPDVVHPKAGIWWQDARLWGFALSAGAAYGFMTLLMTATPISMHDGHGHSLSNTAWVIQSHVVAMFLPSFASGRMVDRWGAYPVMVAGLVAFAGTLVVSQAGNGITEYWIALIFLGIGWNFLYVGATSLLAQYATGSTRFHVQAFNDVIVFSVQALCGLLAGASLALWGWKSLNAYAFTVLVCYACVVVFLLTRRQTPRPISP